MNHLHRLKQAIAFLLVFLVLTPVFSASVYGLIAQPKEEMILAVYTDKPFYSPAEMVTIFGETKDPSGVPIEGASIAIEVRNPRGSTAFIDVTYSMGDGTYQDSFRLAPNVLGGEYNVYTTAYKTEYETAANQTVFHVAEGYWLYASPTSASLSLGGSTSFTIKMMHSSGFDSPVYLSISDLPSGVTAMFNPSTLNPPTVTSTLTLTSTLSAVPDTYLLTVIGTNGTLEQTCNIYLTLTTEADPLSIAQSKRINGENAYQWQTLTYQGTRYYVFIYSTETLGEFSLENSYADLFWIGENLKMEAMIGTEERWIDIPGVIIVDENGNIIRNAELSDIILTLAEAKAYFSFVEREIPFRDNFEGIYEAQETAIDTIYGNPLVLPLLVAYHAPPPSPVKLYKDLIVSAFERGPFQSTVGKSTAGLNKVRRYINIAKKLFLEVFFEDGDAAEIEKYEKAILQSDELRDLGYTGGLVGKLDENLKEIFDKLKKHKREVKAGFYFIDFVLGVACQRTVADEYIPYLEALRNYLSTNPKSTYDHEWENLIVALKQVIQEAQGPNSIWYRILYQVYDLVDKVIWNEALKPFIVEHLKIIVADIAGSFGLSISQVGSLVNGATLGIGLGLIIGDILFDMSSMFYNFDLILKAQQLNSILCEVFDKVSSPSITRLEASITTRRFQFCCLISIYEKLIENADGTGLTGAARWVMNKLRELIQGLLGQEVQTTEEYIDILKKWISKYTLLASESVPPLHPTCCVEPKWSSNQRSSTLVIQKLMEERRGLKDPNVVTSIDINHHYFLINGTAKMNITVTNPSGFTINNVWVNETTNSRVNISPAYAYTDFISPHRNWTTSFNASFNEPGSHALSFQISAEEGNITDFVSVSIRVYLPGINVVMHPTIPTVDDLVEVTVTNSTGAALANATVSTRTPDSRTLTNSTDASGTISFIANRTGLWSIIVTHPNYPVFGPDHFVVLSGDLNDFELTMSNVNASRIAANATYCRSYTIVNDGLNDLQLNITLLGGIDWLSSWIQPVNSTESSYQNSTLMNNRTASVHLPTSHWTSGFVFFHVQEGTALGSNTTLTLNVSATDPPIFREEPFNVTVDTSRFIISMLYDTSPIYEEGSLTVHAKVQDNYGSFVSPDNVEARLDATNVTANLVHLGTGLYNITLKDLSVGTHVFEINAWKTGFLNGSRSMRFYVHPRTIHIDLIAEQIGYTLRLRAILNDTTGPKNMTGSSVQGVITDLQGNRTSIVFTEVHPEKYESNFTLTDSEKYTLTILASRTEYESASAVFTLELQRIVSFNVWPNQLSPNNDDNKDETAIKAAFFTNVSWTILVVNGTDVTIRTWNGTAILGPQLWMLLEQWNGKDDDGRVVPDGTYRIILSGRGASLLLPQQKRVVVDTVQPTITDVDDFPDPFDPHIGERCTINYTLSENCMVKVKISDPSGLCVMIFRETQTAGSNSLVWEGKTQGCILPDGNYAYEIYVADMAGNNATTYPATGLVEIRSHASAKHSASFSKSFSLFDVLPVALTTIAVMILLPIARLYVSASQMTAKIQPRQPKKKQ